MTARRFEDFEVLEVLSESGFACSLRAVSKATGAEVILRRISHVATTPSKAEVALREADALCEAVRGRSDFDALGGCFAHEGHVFLVVEGDECVSLQRIAAARAAQRGDGLAVLTPTELTVLVVELVQALSALHAAGRRHGDVRPSNVAALKAAAPAAQWFRLGGLGASLLDDDDVVSTLQAFDLNFAAPELARKVEGVDEGAPLTPAADMWALGATLLALGVGFRLRDGGVDAVRRFRNGTWTFEADALGRFSAAQRAQWAALNPLAREVVAQCLVAAPADRVAADEVRADPFFDVAAPLVAALRDAAPRSADGDGGGTSGVGDGRDADEWSRCDALYRRAASGDAAARRSLTTRAQLGSRAADALLLVLRLDGHGVPRDTARAQAQCARLFGWLQAQQTPRAPPAVDFVVAKCFEAAGVDAATLDALPAPTNALLGALLVERDADRAEALYARAAGSGHAPAQWALGAALLRRDAASAAAVDWLRAAAAQAFAPAQLLLGERCAAAADDDEALRWLRAAAAAGFAPAVARLGAWRLAGRGGPPDCDEALRLLRTAADAGDAEAQAQLGVCLAEGRGAPLDAEEAARWLQRAAAQGHAEAELQLGQLLERGLCGPAPLTPRDGDEADADAADEAQRRAREAARWFKRAAQRGHRVAQHRLAQCFFAGRGVAQSAAAAAVWFQLSADAGYAPAMHSLGACCERGEGVPRDAARAFALYEAAATQGHAAAQNALGNCLKQRAGLPPDRDEARDDAARLAAMLRWYRAAAAQGLAAAQHNLGVCAYGGLGGPRDLDEAARWFRAAAAQGYGPAAHNFGVCLRRGEGVAADAAEAVRWFRDAAERGVAAAQHQLALCLLRGEGVATDAAEAVAWQRRAAEGGHAAAQLWLGSALAAGQLLAPDLDEAARWFRAAAAQGNARAQFLLGNCLFHGQGAPRDVVEAEAWYRRSAAQGDADAAAALARPTFTAALLAAAPVAAAAVAAAPPTTATAAAPPPATTPAALSSLARLASFAWPSFVADDAGAGGGLSLSTLRERTPAAAPALADASVDRAFFDAEGHESLYPVATRVFFERPASLSPSASLPASPPTSQRPLSVSNPLEHRPARRVASFASRHEDDEVVAQGDAVLAVI